MHHRPATRAEALRLLEAFVPGMGSRYASGRNFDNGPGRHESVSTLSPYIRRRLVTEREVVAAALDAHGPEGAEKFVQEIVWRGYFKGWLERRPQVWDAYCSGLAHDLASIEKENGLGERLEAAETGRTGIDCFDAWARELVGTGYLHNHARMWFASIWIFTLGLPWRLGADFFYRHLLDGDPASNTLSWRWVAGLHTRGKPYEARAWNITKFTGQRFAPAEHELSAGIVPLSETEEPEGLPPVSPLREAVPPDPDQPAVLLITEEDLLPETFAPEQLDIRGAAMLSASHLRSPRPVSEDVKRFERDALSDAADRVGIETVMLTADDLADWAAATGARQIVTPYLPRGPLFDAVEAASDAIEARGLTLREWRRDWDGLIWPHATAGFFKVKKRIPRLLEDSGLS